ncbi:MAG: YceI family protein [Magnetovibrionaceae bacterium]
MKKAFLAAGLALAIAGAGLATPAAAAPEKYVLDASHSQIVFAYNHLGYSTTYGMYSGFDGELMLDADNPEASSVKVSFPVKSMITGWDKRSAHFLDDNDFFKVSEHPDVTFVSTKIERTGDKTANITGDLSMNGMTKEVVIAATLNQVSDHPMKKKGWAGFDGETTVLRSDFGVGKFAPFVSDEVKLMISIEAMKAE